MPIIPMFRMPLLPAELAEKYGSDIEGRNLIHLAVENGQVEVSVRGLIGIYDFY